MKLIDIPLWVLFITLTLIGLVFTSSLAVWMFKELYIGWFEMRDDFNRRMGPYRKEKNTQDLVVPVYDKRG